MNSTKRPCRERLLATLLENDRDPKIYPISPPPDGYAVVCVWTEGEDCIVGALDEFESEAAQEATGYQSRSRCLYFTVPRAVAETALSG